MVESIFLLILIFWDILFYLLLFEQLYKNKDGLEFWDQKFDAPNLHIEDDLESVEYSDLLNNNKIYQERILKNNNTFLIKILKFAIMVTIMEFLANQILMNFNI